jgi:hypothetical protein
MRPSFGGWRAVGVGIPLDCLGLQAVILEIVRVEGFNVVNLDLGELSRRLVLDKVLSGHLRKSDWVENKTIR